MDKINQALKKLRSQHRAHVRKREQCYEDSKSYAHYNELALNTNAKIFALTYAKQIIKETLR